MTLPLSDAAACSGRAKRHSKSLAGLGWLVLLGIFAASGAAQAQDATSAGPSFAKATAGEPAGAGSAGGREYTDLDAGWKFSLENYANAMLPQLDDSGWRTVNVPHDWSVEGPLAPNYGSGNGFAPGGIGWYRRHFQLGAADAGKRVTAEFDGVYDNAEVWLNGFLVGGRPYGFESFACDLTPYVKTDGADNVLVVRVDHSRYADSRWYTGSGIYRDVRLCVTNPLHLGQWGTYVTTPEVTDDAATVAVETLVENDVDKDCHYALVTEVRGPDGQVLGVATVPGLLGAGQNTTVTQELKVTKPQRWSPDSPVLYSVHTQLTTGQVLADDTTTLFGVRTLAYDAEKGFLLNGVPTKLKGVCVHQDGGSVGVAITPAIWERRLTELKAIGVNAIRTSHNPPAPWFLDLCDRMGFLVMDEAFDEYTPGKNKWVQGWNQGQPSRFGYNEFFARWSVTDIGDMVRRDRNHPCIVMWSIGNEIDYPNDPFTDPALGEQYRPGNPPGTDMVKWGKPLVAAVKAQDRTRPVTAALASVAMSNAVGFAQILDIAGYNYQEPRYGDDAATYPQRVIYGSENKHDYAAWVAVRDNPRISGQFLWTGVDYLGEARAWPQHANGDGLLDLCGFRKPMAWFRASLWSAQSVVYLCVGKAQSQAQIFACQESWNQPEGSTVTVSCFTNCPEVTLTLNGNVVGTKKLADAENGVLSWEVPYAPGVLKAVGSQDGKELAEYALTTAGAPARIIATATEPSADGRGIRQVELQIVDAQGVRVPDAENVLTVTVDGPGKILGIGSGNISDTESNAGPQYRAYQGRALVIVDTSAGGPSTLTVTGAGLEPAKVGLGGN